jgi:hypothetical protein
MERLRKLRLEREAAQKPVDAPGVAWRTEAATRQREHPEKITRSKLKAAPRQSRREQSGSTPRTLSDWIKQQERDGGRY